MSAPSPAVAIHPNKIKRVKAVSVIISSRVQGSRRGRERGKERQRQRQIDRERGRRKGNISTWGEGIEGQKE